MEPARRILLVDDEASILFAFSQYLKAPGMEIDTAETSEAALSLIEKKDYRAMVVDLRLTGATTLEGYEIIRRLKKLRPDCMVIVVTAYGGPEIMETLELLGVDLYFEKPVSPKVIKDALSREGVYQR
jgi:DNA-binding response OmpR family regulator